MRPASWLPTRACKLCSRLMPESYICRAWAAFQWHEADLLCSGGPEPDVGTLGGDLSSQGTAVEAEIIQQAWQLNACTRLVSVP